jgi:hypothetical protein
MAVTHTTATRNALAEAIRSAVNNGSTGTLTIHQTSGDTLLATIALATFGAASSGVITSASSGNADSSADATGTAGYARVNAATSGTEIFRGAVGVGSGEVQISSTSIAAGDTVTLTSSVTWTAPT